MKQEFEGRLQKQETVDLCLPHVLIYRKSLTVDRFFNDWPLGHGTLILFIFYSLMANQLYFFRVDRMKKWRNIKNVEGS